MYGVWVTIVDKGVSRSPCDGCREVRPWRFGLYQVAWRLRGRVLLEGKFTLCNRCKFLYMVSGRFFPVDEGVSQAGGSMNALGRQA